ncbi:MAG: hypothetical protein M1503_03560 [Thaumarchaeota archaeon]|nr:hypothetical protein [Nitrososphaerota archaeon]MCL5317330.1 hypothetical protein [Nitrososphaerota archaeon]
MSAKPSEAVQVPPSLLRAAKGSRIYSKRGSLFETLLDRLVEVRERRAQVTDQLLDIMRSNHAAAWEVRLMEAVASQPLVYEGPRPGVR